MYFDNSRDVIYATSLFVCHKFAFPAVAASSRTAVLYVAFERPLRDDVPRGFHSRASQAIDSGRRIKALLRGSAVLCGEAAEIAEAAMSTTLMEIGVDWDKRVSVQSDLFAVADMSSKFYKKG